MQEIIYFKEQKKLFRHSQKPSDVFKLYIKVNY